MRKLRVKYDARPNDAAALAVALRLKSRGPAGQVAELASFAPIESRLMRIKSLFVICLAVVTSIGAAESTNRLHFPASGFSISPLEATPGEKTHQVMMMWLPPTPANVNVQIQPYGGSIEEYAALTLKQFKEHKAEVISQKKVGDSVFVVDYVGELEGQRLHWYARAEKSGGHVYLATGTTTEALWPGQATQIKACVDSFRCERGEQAAAPKAASPRR